jgi:predicted enzyme related to lactoylglutathione lyase
MTTRRAVASAVAALALTVPGWAVVTRAQDAARPGVAHAGGRALKIVVTSVMVGDQEKALRFYTDVLGFIKKTDVPAGGARWLTVVSPDQPDGPELLLEPMGFEPAKVYQQALFDAGIPLTMFGVADVEATYQRLKGRGVVFKMPPTKMGPVTIAMFEDTCGNLIQVVQR